MSNLAKTLALLGVAASFVGAAHAATTTTYTVRLDKSSLVTSVNVPPKGESAGDVHVFSASVLSGRRVVGRLEGVSTAVDPRYGGVSFTMLLQLPRGTVVLQGGGFDKQVPGLPPVRDEVLAVTGGTGVYATAAGTATLLDLGPTTQRLVLKLS